MKKLLLTFLAFASFNAFAQSFIIMDNGLIITTDSKGFVYDIGDYAFPLKVTMKGGQYFVEENSVLATIDENGVMFRKYEVIPEKVLGKGINYFLSATGDLTTIDNRGNVKVISNPIFTGAVNFGGSYFTVRTSESMLELYVVTKAGDVVKADLGALKMSDVVAFGGTYFMTNRGVVHTVSADGRVLPQPGMRVGVLQKRGGNYFTDSAGMIYTVSEDGTLNLPGIPSGMKVSSMMKLGSNYFLDISGRLFTVSKDGKIFEGLLPDHDFRNARIISL